MTTIDRAEYIRHLETRHPEEFEEGIDIGQAVAEEMRLADPNVEAGHVALAAYSLALEYGQGAGRFLNTTELNATALGAEEAVYQAINGGQK